MDRCAHVKQGGLGRTRTKVGVLELAKQLGNVSQACKMAAAGTVLAMRID
jgi:hypothetical protein